MEFLTPSVILTLLIVLTLVTYWTTNFIIFYHLVRFGVGTQPKKIAFFFLIGSITFFFFSVSSFALIDLRQTGNSISELMSAVLSKPYLQ